VKRKTAREILADSLRELAAQMSVDRITVKAIAENCGYSQATFYRQFRDKYDLIAWVPVSRLRKLKRGYDQVELIANALCNELQIMPEVCLKKIRHNPPQSSIPSAAQRRANVLGVYKVPAPELVAGKRILLLDDIITTGATISECAKTLMAAGAKEVYGVAVATTRQHKMNQ
jgi:ComF family protein